MSERTADAEKWRVIADHWIRYCKGGAGVFDWNYGSRPVMEELTGEAPFQWMSGDDD